MRQGDNKEITLQLGNFAIRSMTEGSLGVAVAFWRATPWCDICEIV